MSFNKINNIVIILITLLVASCAMTRPTGKTEAEILFKEADLLIKDSRYILATEKLNTIRSQYPYSIYSTKSELVLADVLFKQENFVEAAAAYTLFKDFHPKYKKIDYVVLRIAESFYEQIPTFDRDLTPAFEAIKYYKELINFYPASTSIEEANKKISLCEDRIRSKEKYIADFYFKTEVFDSARYRYLDILNTFSGPKEFIDHSKTRIVQASLYLNNKPDCKKYYNQYGHTVSGDYKKIMDETLGKCNDNK